MKKARKKREVLILECTGFDHNPNPYKTVQNGALCIECDGFIPALNEPCQKPEIMSIEAWAEKYQIRVI